MGNVVYRPLSAPELDEAADVYLTARDDMQRRAGGTAPPPDRDGARADYEHVLRTGIFQVAEVDGRLGGVCCAVVRDDLWFLAGFWVRPGLQGQGIGGPLLRSVWHAGREAGARTCFVWSSSDLPALGSYMKLGMMPQYTVLGFGGALVRAPAPLPAGYSAEPLAPALAADIDQAVRATRREQDHAFWQSRPGCEGRLIRFDGVPVGYFYHRGGLAGPVAWTEPVYGEAVLGAALALAGAGGATVRLLVPGVCPQAVRFALDAGLQVNRFAHFLSTGPVGRPDRYLPSGPLLY